MSSDHGESDPLLLDPLLAAAAAAVDAAGQWAFIVDDKWRLVHTTHEMRVSFGSFHEPAAFADGMHFFGPEALAAAQLWKFGYNTAALNRALLKGLGAFVLADAGGRDELRALVDPAYRDVVDELSPADVETICYQGTGTGLIQSVNAPVIATRIRDPSGRLAGTMMLAKPAVGMATLFALTSMGDLRNFERTQSVANAARRPAGILFADLDASSPLARRLSTASYFALGRRLVRATDQCIIDAGGLVGRHVGDGVVAFVLAETAGSESAAARACITAARTLRAVVGDVATRSELTPDDVVLRFGLHWGSTLYVGSITTAGRTEVTALGDEVNEGARIEACATGGRALASKAIMERLNPEDAAALDVDPDRITYTALGELETATDKARRDAPAIAVCDV